MKNGASESQNSCLAALSGQYSHNEGHNFSWPSVTNSESEVGREGDVALTLCLTLSSVDSHEAAHPSD